MTTEYPKAKYKAGEQVHQVNSPAEEKALGAGWTDHPDPKFVSQATLPDRRVKERRVGAPETRVPVAKKPVEAPAPPAKPVPTLQPVQVQPVQVKP